MIDDYNVLKGFSREELLSMVPKDFKFYTDPWDHQISSFLACIANDEFLLALDLGTGKTKVSIDTCRYIQKVLGKRINGIVVCNNSAVEKWVEEVETHSTEITAIAIRGEDERDGPWWNSGVTKKAKEVKRELLLDTSYNLKVVGFESFRSLCCFRQEVPNQKYRQEVVDLAMVGEIIKTQPNVFIIDESHKVKNNRSLIFNICNLISRRVKYRYLLTGTPFNNLIDIWAQYYLIDRGKIFGRNFYKFRQNYFDAKSRYIKSRGIEITEYRVSDSGKKYIMDNMYRKAIRYSEDEVKGMPNKVFERIEYSLSKEQQTDYLKLMEGLEESKKKFGDNASMTYRQICSGFIIRTDKYYKSNPKLDLVMEMLESIIEHSKVVIFHVFIPEYKLLSERLNKAKIKFCAINGAIKNKYEQNKRFLDDPKYRVMVANVKSGSESIDLQSARYAFFFSNDHSIITRKQAIKRIHRGSITRTRFYYDFTAKDTIEKSIYWSIKNGVNLFDEVMDGNKFKEILMGKVNEKDEESSS